MGGGVGVAVSCLLSEILTCERFFCRFVAVLHKAIMGWCHRKEKDDGDDGADVKSETLLPGRTDMKRMLK